MDIGDQILPCRKIDQGLPSAIFITKTVELVYPMLHAKFQDHRT